MPENAPLFLNRYQLLKQIGRGGMATIFLAKDLQDGLPVAIKFLTQQGDLPDTVKTRFRLEAKSLAQLSHPNIVKILDYGEVDGHPYFTLEWVPGGTLADRLGKPHPYPEAAGMLLPVACALEYAHLRGIIHRDVKPGNILIDEQGAPKLTDFGIAKYLTPPPGSALTGANTGIGTPEYMAPEQGLGKDVDQRTDIYSLGVILFELVTGKKPYLADTPLATMMQHAVQPLPRAGEIVAGLPERVDEVLSRALAKDPADRYQTMGDFIEDLGRLAGAEWLALEEAAGVPAAAAAAPAGLPPAATQPPPPGGPAGPPPPAPAPIFYDPHHRRWKWFKRSSLILMLLVIGVLSILLIGILTVPRLPKVNLTLPGGAGFGGMISHPSPTATGLAPTSSASAVPEQIYQDIKSTLGAYQESPTVTSVPQVTLVPINPPTSTSAPKPTSTPTQPIQPTATPAPTSTQPPATAAPPPTPTPVKTRRNTPQPHPTPTPRPHPAVYFPAAGGDPAGPRLSLASDLLDQGAPAPPAAGSPGRPLLIGFYVDWDDNAAISLRQNIGQLDRLVPEWLHLADDQGTIVDDNLGKENQVLNEVRQTRPGLVITPLLNNINPQTHQWDGASLARMLADPAARSRAVESLLQYLQNNHLGGVDIDFESLPKTSQGDLTVFMQELYARLHPLGLEVSQAIPFDDETYDARALSACSDYLIFMAYDEHWSSGAAGPIAAQDWYASGLRRRLSEVPPEKLVIAVGNYGYDWAAGAQQGASLTFQEAIQRAQGENAAISFDSGALNPVYTYVDAQQQSHRVWYLDAATAFNEIAAAQPYGPRGFALWRLGSEDPTVWQVFARRESLGQPAAAMLETLHYGDSVYYDGQGEILRVSAVPADGSRQIDYDPSRQLILSETMRSFPSPYIITRWGSSDPKAVALTFDDGPDPVYTPRILDVLKKYQVPATFFVIGSEGDLHPDILKEVVAAGDEIGNHTYTHPDVSAISENQLRLELNATQLLFESRLGLQSILFRPPYGEDIEPETAEEVKPLVYTSQMGYYTIGMQIDPGDWRRPGVSAIAGSVVSSVLAGSGKVVLLHDGGGDRSQTVAALPQIIDQLRSHGYRFVLVSDLMGLRREEVMPPLPLVEKALTQTSGVGFQLIGLGRNLVSFLFAFSIILGVFRMFVITLLATVQWFQSEREEPAASYQPAVSIIVPAYNEGKVIHRTVQSLLDSTYPHLDVIVVDDGSTDGTSQRLAADFPDQPRLSVLTKANGGKASAINAGLSRTQAEIVVVIDADTLVLPDAVGKLVRRFADPRVGAVAGNSKVGNRLNLLTRWQALEYITSQNMDRRAFALLNCMSVVPGAIGAWRRELVLSAGGVSTDTLAEDADLTLRILRDRHRIEYEDRAIALTEAPDTVGGFLKQRFRWMYGTLQAAWKYREVTFRPRYGAMGLITLPNIIFFQILFPLVSPLMDLMLVLSIAGWFWGRAQHPADFSYAPLVQILFFYLVYMIIDLLSAGMAFSFEGGEDWRLIAWLFLQRFFYRQLIYYVAVKSTITAIRGQRVGWGKLERKATVKL